MCPKYWIFLNAVKHSILVMNAVCSGDILQVPYLLGLKDKIGIFTDKVKVNSQCLKYSTDHIVLFRSASVSCALTPQA